MWTTPCYTSIVLVFTKCACNFTPFVTSLGYCSGVWLRVNEPRRVVVEVVVAVEVSSVHVHLSTSICPFVVIRNVWNRGPSWKRTRYYEVKIGGRHILLNGVSGPSQIFLFCVNLNTTFKPFKVYEITQTFIRDIETSHVVKYTLTRNYIFRVFHQKKVVHY